VAASLEAAAGLYELHHDSDALALADQVRRESDGGVAANAAMLAAHCHFELGSLRSARAAAVEADEMFAALGGDDVAPGQGLVAVIDTLLADEEARIAHELQGRHVRAAELVERGLALAGPIDGPPTIVDLGCGDFVRSSERILAHHPGARLYGLDVDPAVGDDERWTTMTNGGGFFAFDLSGGDDPPDLEADLVTTSGLLSAIPDLDLALDRTADLLRLGGALVGGYDRRPVQFAVRETHVAARVREVHPLASMGDALAAAGFGRIDVWENALALEFPDVRAAARYLTRRDPQLRDDLELGRRLVEALPEMPDLHSTWTMLCAVLGG
jgi:trans-aconitate methyltransferase